mgnify:CR=1 FL=1
MQTKTLSIYSSSASPDLTLTSAIKPLIPSSRENDHPQPAFQEGAKLADEMKYLSLRDSYDIATLQSCNLKASFDSRPDE